MEITILGSGTVTPNLRRNASGLFIRDDGHRVLIDMGPGVMRRMCEAGIDGKTIDAILLTHFHPDHVSDLVPFLFSSNYEFGAVRTDPFGLMGPQGLENLYRGLVAVYGDWIVPQNDRLVLTELDSGRPDSVAMGSLTVRSAPAMHARPSLHYRLESGGLSVTVSGDTDYSEELAGLAGGTDVLICECSLPDGMKQPGHLVPSEAGRIARSAGAGMLVLTHFYPPCDEVDVVAQAKAEFSGPIIKAEDLMVIPVGSLDPR